MRIGGLASGIDTDSMIKDLMKAERIPLDKLEQQRTKMEWQRDAFRDINKQIAELERLIEDMRLTSNTINPKTVSSSMEGAITATGSAAASNGAYKIAVEQLATNAINTGTASMQDINEHISQNIGQTVSFHTFDEEEGIMKERSFTIEESDTIDSIVKKIQDADKNIRAFYDEASETLVMETKRTGKYNTTEQFAGAEIGFVGDGGKFFTELFKMQHDDEKGGEDAIFHYNDAVELTSKDNRYTLNGITFTFHDVTGTDESGELINATLTITNDIDKAVENITNFVNKYNELITTLNDSQQETIYRDFPPLTEQQMEEMTEKQIELWEEKAKSGLLRRESIIPSALTSFRSTWSTTVDNDGAFRLMAQIGITTTENYMDGGLLKIDEDILREKLEEDATSVQNLLFSNTEGSSRGLLNQLEDALETTIGRIEQRAGKDYFTNQMYTMGRELETMEKRIKAFEDRLERVEDRYWRQFSAMERAISMMNNQSAMLMSFGGNMYQ